MMSMSKISMCEMTTCSYNMDQKCHTMAITVGNGACAACDTFTSMPMKGGAADMVGGVGACRRDACRHNSNLECVAGMVAIGMHSGHADCKTFAAR